MDWGWLAFLAEPWFVVGWYAFGAAAAAWVIYDTLHANRQMKSAMKAPFPIIVFFFSILGLAIYVFSARAPGIGGKQGEAAKQAHREYTSNPLRKVTGPVIHCVGGDGLGIMTAMVMARIANLSFWQEFWFEYAAGYAFGWFIFQYMSFRNMGDGPFVAWMKGGRAEFFSMITVMGGMGAVMGLVTPRVVGAQPDPSTAAFWGFGFLGLFAGFVATYPTNWLLVKIGWKHGMG